KIPPLEYEYLCFDQIRLNKEQGSLDEQRPRCESGALVIFFPGAGYRTDMPLLYYPMNHCLDLGMDTLSLNYNFKGIDTKDRQRRYEETLNSIEDLIAAACHFSRYSKIAFMGKSLGTKFMADVMKSSNQKVDLTLVSGSIWLTPLWNNHESFETMLACDASSLHIIGSLDPCYSVQLDRILQESGKIVKVIDGADHGLDVPGDVNASIAILGEVVAETCAVLGTFMNSD
ncbi:MAG: hypothetical protein NT027_20335, partial [Proteobacteria bacterium]|nr:hypothetical protein [Pseudomonadota bacterium]